MSRIFGIKTWHFKEPNFFQSFTQCLGPVSQLPPTALCHAPPPSYDLQELRFNARLYLSLPSSLAYYITWILISEVREIKR